MFSRIQLNKRSERATLIAVKIWTVFEGHKMEYALDSGLCKQLVMSRAFRFGAALWQPWAGLSSCTAAISEEVDRAFSFLESLNVRTSMAFTSVDKCVSSGCITIRASSPNQFGFDIGAVSGINGTDIILNSQSCFYQQQCAICFDDNFQVFKTVRQGLLAISVIFLLLCGYLMVKKTEGKSKSLRKMSYSEMRQEIIRLQKQKVHIETQERLCGERIEKITAQKVIFKRELQKKSKCDRKTSAFVGSSPEPGLDGLSIKSVADEDEGEDAEIEHDALTVVRQSLSHKIEDLEERLTDEATQRLDFKMQAVKLEGSVAGVVRAMAKLKRESNRSRLIWSLAFTFLTITAFYLLVLCQNRSNAGCRSLRLTVAERAAEIAGLEQGGLPREITIPPLSDLPRARLASIAKRELGREAFEQCGASNSLVVTCLAKHRASRAQLLVAKYHGSECGSVRQVITTLLYLPEHREAEAAHCLVWKAVLQSVTAGAPRELKNIDWASATRKMNLVRHQHYAWVELFLSIGHRIVFGDGDRNIDGIDDTDVDGNGVPDDLQLSLESFISQ